jgi:uncharacterized FlaG/YvyC family protein
MSSDIFLGGISPYTPSEPVTKSVEARPSPPADKPDSREPAEPQAAEVTQASAPETGAQPVKHLSFDELRDLMRKVNLYINPFEIQVQFIVDHQTGDVAMNVINTVSGEIIREVLPEELNRALDAPGGIRGLFTDRLA